MLCVGCTRTCAAQGALAATKSAPAPVSGCSRRNTCAVANVLGVCRLLDRTLCLVKCHYTEITDHN